MTAEDFQRHFSKQHSLSKAVVDLRNFSKQHIGILGSFQAPVKVLQRSSSVVFYVTDKGTSVLGLDAIQRLGIQIDDIELCLTCNILCQCLLQHQLFDSLKRTKKLILCIAYSSKFDLKNMVSDFANAVKADVIESDDICPCLVTEWLALNEASETELWFRSSGERRFSEFLVLQSGYAYMHREAELWPAVSIGHWVRAIVQFQLNWPHIKAVKENHHTHTSACDHKDLGKTTRQRFFLRQVKSTRMARMNALCVDEPTPIDRNSL
ncbi:hypothetical protein MRX96_050399 [Rhipicephalus microplus]